MCLCKVYKTTKVTNGEGYKIFCEISKSRKTTITSYQHVRLLTNKWIRDNNKIPIEYVEGVYQPGYHIFKSLNAAMLESEGDIVLKVKYRNVVVTGIQWNREVVVAKEIFIMIDYKWKYDDNDIFRKYILGI